MKTIDRYLPLVYIAVYSIKFQCEKLDLQTFRLNCENKGWRSQHLNASELFSRNYSSLMKLKSSFSTECFIFSS